MQEFDFHRHMHRPGTIIDAGAHNGALTLRFARLPHTQVIAFEPLPAAFRRLAAAVESAGLDNVTLDPRALGAVEGDVTLSVPRVCGAPQEEWSSIAKDYAGVQADDPRVEAVDRMTVPMIRLDGRALRDVTAMKIDVEGGEREVLDCAAATLVRCRPVLSIEIEERHRPGSTRTVPASLSELGFVGFFELGGEWRPVEQFDPSVLQVASPSPASFAVSDPYVFAFYFVPPERRDELSVLARLPDA